MGSRSSASPYTGQPGPRWLKVTERLLDEHPLKAVDVLDIVMSAWDALWATVVGKPPTQVPLRELHPPAIVTGYLLETLMARELVGRFPGDWRGGSAAEDKDLVFAPDPRYSVEVKCSGQLGMRVFGNRSYGQELQNAARAKKEKSGYYITANFFQSNLFLVRFGWVDNTDWRPQKAPSGQMAGLEDSVYRYKLLAISGEYQMDAPARLLTGVGSKTESELRAFGILTIRELQQYSGPLPERLEAVRQAALNCSSAADF
jgi:hypothetical protein